MNQLLSHLTVFVLGILLGFFILGKSVRTPKPPVVKEVVVDTCLTSIDRIGEIIDTVFIKPDVIEKIIVDTVIMVDSSIYPIDSLSTDSTTFYWISKDTRYGRIDHKLTMGYKRIIESDIEFFPETTHYIRPVESQRLIVLEPKHRVINTSKYVPFEQSYHQLYLGASTIIFNGTSLFGPKIDFRTKNDLLISANVYLGKDNNNFVTLGVSLPIKKFNKD